MKKVSVFLSSTFKDMNLERSYLAINIFPSLRKEYIKKGVDFSWIDLRWGITDEEAEMGLVVPKCLRSIDNCKPYFIGIIGDYYGTSLTKEEIENLDISSTEKAELLNYINETENGISITEIEIIHGVLKNPNAQAIFYFKELDEIKDYRIKRLVATIKDSGFPYDSYTNVEDLGEKVREQIRSFIPDINEEYLSIEKESTIQECILNDYSKDIHNDSEFEELNRKYNFITHDIYSISHPRHDYRSHIISGDQGVGKTSFLAYWIKEMKRKGNNIVYYFINSLSTFKKPAEISEYLVRKILELEDYKHYKVRNEDTPECQLVNVIDYASISNIPLVIVIDGIENLEGNSDSSIEEKHFYWVDNKPHPFVLTVYSGNREDFTVKILAERFSGSEVQVITGVSPSTLERISINTLSKYHKTIISDDVQKITSNKILQNPLFLKRFLELLVSCETHESLPETIDEFSKTESTQDFISTYYQHVLSYFSPGLLLDMLKLLYLSKDGFSVEEIRAQLFYLGHGVKEIGGIITLLDDFLYHNSIYRNVGVVGFKNANARESVQKCIGDNNFTRERFTIVRSLFEELQYPDFLIDKVHIYSEMLHQLYSIGDVQSLYQFILDLKVVYNAKDSTSFVQYWRYLYNHGYSMKGYIEPEKIKCLTLSEKLMCLKKIVDLAMHAGHRKDSMIIAKLAVDVARKENYFFDCFTSKADTKIVKLILDFFISICELCNYFNFGCPNELFDQMFEILKTMERGVKEYYLYKIDLLRVENSLLLIKDGSLINLLHKHSQDVLIEVARSNIFMGLPQKELMLYSATCILKTGIKTNNPLITKVCEMFCEDSFIERAANDLLSFDAFRKVRIARFILLQSRYAKGNPFQTPQHYIEKALAILLEIERSGDINVNRDILDCYTKLMDNNSESEEVDKLQKKISEYQNRIWI